MGILCKKCGNPNRETQKFCDSCGSGLDVNYQIPANDNYESIKCKKCGIYNRNTSNFCSECGQKLTVGKNAVKKIIPKVSLRRADLRTKTDLNEENLAGTAEVPENISQKGLIGMAFRWLLFRNIALLVILVLCILLFGKRMGVVPLILMLIAACYVYFFIFESFLSSDSKNYKIVIFNTNSIKLCWWYSWRCLLVYLPLELILNLLRIYLGHSLITAELMLVLNTGLLIYSIYMQYYFIYVLFVSEHKNFNVQIERMPGNEAALKL